MSNYIGNGYKDRADYLKCLSDDYGIDLETVLCLAEVLGENEDFDGLICTLDDIGEEFI